RLGDLAADKDAEPLFHFDVALGNKAVVGKYHRVSGNAELLAEVARRRQSGTGGELLMQNQLAQLRHQLRLQRGSSILVNGDWELHDDRFSGPAALSTLQEPGSLCDANLTIGRGSKDFLGPGPVVKTTGTPTIGPVRQQCWSTPPWPCSPYPN